MLGKLALRTDIGLGGLCKMLILNKKDGVTDGVRTRDHWNHNPGLYQLSYSHHRKTKNKFL